MTDITYAQVWADHAIAVGEPGETMTVTVLSGDTVYYGDSNVTASTNFGSLTTGQSVTIANPVEWLRSASRSYVQIIGTTLGPSVASSNSRVVPLGSITGTVTCDLSQGVCFTGTLTGNVTINFSNWPASPALTEPLLILAQDGTGGHSITITGAIWEPAGTSPTFDTTATHVNIIPLSSPDQGTHLYGATGTAPATVQGSAGTNLGSTATIDFASAAGEIWLIGTLNANLTVTVSNWVAGSRAILLLTQDATGGRTLNVSDGTTPQAVPIPSAATAFGSVAIDCPDTTNIYVSPLGQVPLLGKTAGTAADGGATEPAFSRWACVKETWTSMAVPGASTASTFLACIGGALAVGAATSGEGAFYLNSADFPGGGRSALLRLRASCLTNAVAPAVTWTYGLYPVATAGGASGAYPTISALGTAVMTCTIVSPAATTQNHAESASTAFPTAGWYVLAVANSATVATGANTLHGMRLDIDWV